MPHDPLFEQRISDLLAAADAKAEARKMFGGVAFMVNGHMTVGITNKGDLMVRFAADRHEEISAWPGAKPMTFGKSGMKGFLFVDAPSVATARTLGRWVDLSLGHIRTLPAKAAGKSAPKKAAKAAAGAAKKSSKKR